MFVVQPFRKDEDGMLVAGEPQQAQSEDQARRRAQKIAPEFDGVIAFARSGDQSIGEYEPAKIIAKLGAVPDELE